MCIDGVKAGTPGTQMDWCGYYSNTNALPGEEVYESEEYTVIEEEAHCGETYYQLAERPEEILYHSSRFVRLSEADADEMQEENHEAIIYQR
jgi:hypothetical protein